MKGRLLENLTWLEAEKALKRYPVIVTPMGARLKEHGPHLPLNNDWIMAEYLARRIERICPVLVLPTIQYGYYPAFKDYPGSVSLGLETSRDLVMDICRSFARHGARRHYILNTGISTVRALEPARTMLALESIRMEYTDLHKALAEVEGRVRESEGGTHADEIETSMMLYIAPESVRMKKARRDYDARGRAGGLTRDPKAETGVYSPTGVWGDPTRATRAKGRAVVEALVAHAAADIRRLANKRR
jgi:creatinine amidohydrolase